MNKKQLITLWMVGILAVIILGLTTDVVIIGITYYEIKCYGLKLFDTAEGGSLMGLAKLGYYKWQLLVSSLIIGGLLIYTLRDKKK